MSSIVLTGATSGIGEALARRLVSMSGRLVVLGPQPERLVSTVIHGIRREGPAEVHYIEADYCEFQTVRDAGRTVLDLVPDIDVLINNAGAPGTASRRTTVDGNERTFQINALAPALLTDVLRPALHSGSRVVNVASAAHRVESFDPEDPDLAEAELAGTYNAIGAYARSKCATLTWSLLLADAFRPDAVDVIAVCPGLNDTPLSAAMMGQIGGPPRRGAARVLHAATAQLPTRAYLEDGAMVAPSSVVTSPEFQRRTAGIIAERIGVPL